MRLNNMGWTCLQALLHFVPECALCRHLQWESEVATFGQCNCLQQRLGNVDTGGVNFTAYRSF